MASFKFMSAINNSALKTPVLLLNVILRLVYSQYIDLMRSAFKYIRFAL